MPIVGDFAKIKRAQRVLKEIGRTGSPANKKTVGGAVPSIKAVIKEQFAKGIDPAGNKQPPRKDGKPALVSEKLGRGGIGVELVGGFLVGSAKTGHLDDILTTQQDGHVFPKRIGRVRQYRGKTGKLISNNTYVRRIMGDNARYGHINTGNHSNGLTKWTYQSIYHAKTRKDGTVKETFVGSRQTTTGVHFGPRILPPRLIHPVGTVLPKRWGDAIARGVYLGLRKTLGSIK